MLRKAESESLIRGIRFGNSGPSLTHLLFADDSLLFAEATSNNVTAIKDILHEYEDLSGQAINLDKSSAYFSKDIDEVLAGNLCTDFGVQRSVGG